ncbi:unnamed protein product [Acanthoscelides obtectus]|nr:unnamed protein product [Acanthoscelides obtectus]CAK1672554.1 hypothetical protein AOBTE_LOCUS28962 [Acanthoscelides obtectus]
MKIYNDNVLLSDTADDDFILSMIRENLKISHGFMSILKLILEFLLTTKEISIMQISSVPIHSAQILLATFNHCRQSTELYKQTYNIELLELFHLAQEIHLLFLNLMEACSIVSDLLENNQELDILTEVLDILCEMSLALCDLNLKSMSNNWKGYLAIVVKFIECLKPVFCLETPMKSLTHQIIHNLASLDMSESTDEKPTSKIVTVTGFLIKVVLKVLDLFWDIGRTCDQVLQFCFIVLSYQPGLFETFGYSSDVINLIKSNVTVVIDQLTSKIYCELDGDNILKCCRNCGDAPLGVIIFLNNYLNFILENFDQTMEMEKDVILNEIITLLFHYVSVCTYELHFKSEHEGVYDKLVINVSRSLLVVNNLYLNTEEVLLRNVLQENIFCSLLAVEVWDIVLINTSAQFQLEIIEKLVKIYKQLNFGMNTYRPEALLLKFLLRRLFRNLPYPMKVLFTQTHSFQERTKVWKVIGLGSFPEQQSHFVSNLCFEMNKKIQAIDKDHFRLGDLIYVGEHLEILSTANFNILPLEQTRSLVSTIGALWSLEFNDFSNNMWKYFIVKLLRITATLITEFSVNKLFLILKELKTLAAQDDLKIAVCNVLKAFAEKNSNELGQDMYKVFTLISHVIYPHLLNDINNVVKQYVLEVIDLYYQKNKHDIIEELMKSSKANQEELSDYLERKVRNASFDKTYFITLSKQMYRHECVSWREVMVNQPMKKFRAEFPEIEPNVEKVKVVRSIKERPERKVQESNVQEEILFDDIGDAIATLRSDVKALRKLLNKEKMTAKNVSALKLLTNELLSFL